MDWKMAEIVYLSSCHETLFPGNVYVCSVQRWILKHSVTVSSIHDDLSTYVEPKLFGRTAYWMINIPLDDKGKQNELVWDGSSQP